MTPLFPRQPLAAAALLFASASAFAATTGTWNVDTDGVWSNAGNWSGGVPGANGDTANFTNDITADHTVTLDSARTLTNLAFGDADTATAGNWVISNGGTPGNTLSVSNITVNVLGTGATATVGAKLIGNGALTITGAGTLNINGGLSTTGLYLNGGSNVVYNSVGGTSSDLRIGNTAGGTNNFTIAGGDLSVSTPLYFSYGAGSTGTLTQTGGTLTLNGLRAANQTGGIATINLSGGTLISTTDSFVLNQRGTTTMTVSGTANVTINGVLLSGWTANTSSTTLNLDGGTLTTDGLYEGSSSPGNIGANNSCTTTVNLNGGVLKARSETAAANFLTVVDAVNVKAGGAIFDTNGFNVTAGKALVHDSALGASLDGGLTKNGLGTLTLSGANTYTGATTVNTGALTLTGSIAGTSAVSLAGTLTVFNNSTFANTVTGAGVLEFKGNGTSGNGTYNVSGTNSGFSGTILATGARISPNATTAFGSATVTVAAGGQVFLGGGT